MISAQEKKIVKILSPLPGLIARVNVKTGSYIRKGEEILVLNVMKTEIPVVSEYEGIVKEIHVKEWDEVDINSPLIVIELSSEEKTEHT